MEAKDFNSMQDISQDKDTPLRPPCQQKQKETLTNLEEHRKEHPCEPGGDWGPKVVEGSFGIGL